VTAPEVLVDVDLAVGSERLQAWHRFARGRVTALTATGSGLRLDRFPATAWQRELARLVTVPAPTAPVEPPPGELDLPLELLLGTGEALRLGRDDVVAELVRRQGTGLDPVRLRRLHTACLGRVRAVVSGVGASGARRVGWVSWVLFADGWRALTPYASGGTAMVRVHRVEPPWLGVEVARLLTRVRR
jgi:hypothetical protein